ncbi:MAG: hypothetical protein WCC36_04070 [Gammaproteobacteria bacterium]
MVFFFVLPAGCRFGDRSRLFARALAPARATYRSYGLGVETVGRGDLWLDGRKILGSGAATINRANVLGASFLLSFPAKRFAALLRCPSAGYRRWLEEELDNAMTAWSDHASSPPAEGLARCFQRHVEAEFGWRLRPDTMTDSEHEASAAAITDVEDVSDGPRQPFVPGGVKLNHHCFLLEGSGAIGWARLVLRHGRIGRIALSHAQLAEPLVGQLPNAEILKPILAGRAGSAEAAEWAGFIERLARPARSGWDE